MHRQSLNAYGAPLCETIVEAPQPQGTEALVRIERCGVCHSDLHMQDGYFLLGDGKKLDVQAGRTLPFTLGHEIAGLVESTGPDADVKPGAKVAVYRVLKELAARGRALVVVSSELPELMALCDRIAVMSAGRLVATFARESWNEEAIVAAAFSEYARGGGGASPGPTVPC